MQKNVLPPEKIYLPDGTELRLCKGIVSRTGNRKLYCSKAGLFYSLSTRGLNPNKPYVTKNFRRKPNVHSNYPRLCGWVGNPNCHILVAIAWIGPGTSSRQTGWRSQLTFGFEKGRWSGRPNRPRSPEKSLRKVLSEQFLCFYQFMFSKKRSASAKSLQSSAGVAE